MDGIVGRLVSYRSCRRRRESKVGIRDRLMQAVLRWLQYNVKGKLYRSSATRRVTTVVTRRKMEPTRSCQMREELYQSHLGNPEAQFFKMRLVGG